MSTLDHTLKPEAIAVTPAGGDCGDRPASPFAEDFKAGIVEETLFLVRLFRRSRAVWADTPAGVRPRRQARQPVASAG